jgi:hypothetical protein
MPIGQIRYDVAVYALPETDPQFSGVPGGIGEQLLDSSLPFQSIGREQEPKIGGVGRCNQIKMDLCVVSVLLRRPVPISVPTG